MSTSTSGNGWIDRRRWRYDRYMTLDHDSCYRAHRSRDRRFDGLFFTAVLSTGIYCRPICPARTPLSENVRFYSCAAAAEDAGFRACMRCRPESAPGSPRWRGTSSTVSRALRLIEQGALDGASTARLAERLGISERHLRRLFADHLGASPTSVARTRRIHFARRLLEQSTLSVTDVAFSSGFSSLRRFNAEIRRAFGRSPRELRKTVRSAEPITELRLRLPVREPFAWQTIAHYLANREVDSVESVSPERYCRLLSHNGRAVGLDVRYSGPGALTLTIHRGEPADYLTLVGVVRRLFDLDSDPGDAHEQLSRSPVVGRHQEQLIGLRIPGSANPIEICLFAILAQGIRLNQARKLISQIAARYGVATPGILPELTRLFPEVQLIAGLEQLDLNVPEIKLRAIRELCRQVADGRLCFDQSQNRADVVERLLAIPGIGPWTTEYIALRALGDPDAFPAGDAVLRRVAAEGSKPLTTSALHRVAEAWHPWRGYAAMALWLSQSDARE